MFDVIRCRLIYISRRSGLYDNPQQLLTFRNFGQKTIKKFRVNRNGVATVETGLDKRFNTPFFCAVGFVFPSSGLRYGRLARTDRFIGISHLCLPNCQCSKYAPAVQSQSLMQVSVA